MFYLHVTKKLQLRTLESGDTYRGFFHWNEKFWNEVMLQNMYLDAGILYNAHNQPCTCLVTHAFNIASASLWDSATNGTFQKSHLCLALARSGWKLCCRICWQLNQILGHCVFLDNWWVFFFLPPSPEWHSCWGNISNCASAQGAVFLEWALQWLLHLAEG